MSLFDLPPQPEAASDVAYTPAVVAEAIVQHLCDLYGYDTLASVWEPCAGRGDFVRALQSVRWGKFLQIDVNTGQPVWCHHQIAIYSNELDPHAESIQQKLAGQADMFQVKPPVSAVITNPPFSQAARLLRHCMEIPTCTLIVFLLNHSWIVPDGKGEEIRNDLLWGPTATLDRQILLYPRIKFEGPARDGKGQDQREYALCCWKKEGGTWAPPGRPTLLTRLEWR